MREPDEAAMEFLALLFNRYVVPEDGAFLEAQHARDSANQAGLAAAVAPLEHQQTAAFQRKRETGKKAAFATDEGEVVGR